MPPRRLTSPITSVTPHQVHHAREVFERDLPTPVSIDLQEFYSHIGTSVPTIADKSSLLNSIKGFIRHANELALTASTPKITFLNTSNYYAADHPSSTHSRPDVVAYNLDHLSQLKKLQAHPRVHWPFIEMTMEFHSSGRSFDDRLRQAHSYAAYLLAARPDLDSTLGLLVEKNCMIVFICASSGTKMVKVKKADCLTVLAAIVEYLNDGQPKARASHIIKTVASDYRATFTLRTGRRTFKDCTLDTVGYPFGRRTNIFVPKEMDGNLPVRVIKEQRIISTTRWTEKEILDAIHQGGTYPGVVRAKFFDQLSTSTSQSKTRIGLLDTGTNFMDIDTPRKVIYALYDLLEVCRGLFRDRGILHRDISPANILWNDSGPAPATNIAEVPTVFVGHLMDPSEPKHKSSIILIDLEHAEVYTSNKQVIGGRSGTSFFIARAIQKGGPLSKPETFPPSPVLRSDAASIYKRFYSDRFKIFGNEMKTPTKLVDRTTPPAFRHELRHDAESGVWAFFLWLLLAAPHGKDSGCISTTAWSCTILDETGIDRQRLFTMLREEDLKYDFAHPEYHPLLQLLTSMTTLIQTDYHWVAEEKYKHPEYLHDALQRVILNFLLENKEESFMDLQKSPAYREVKIMNTPAPLSGPTTNHRRSASARKNKRKVTKSTAHGIQHLALASSPHKSGHGSLKVGRARIQAIAEAPRDIDGQRKVKKRRITFDC